MDAFDPSDKFDVLRSRSTLLESLVEEEKSPAELTVELSVSRSTIDRGLHELERVGYVEIAGGTAQATAAGRLAIETYTEFVEQLDDIGTVSGALESLPPHVQFDPVMVAGSSTVVAEDSDDERPLSQLLSLTDGAVAIRGCIRAVRPAQIESFYRRVLDDDISLQLVATADVVERLITSYRSHLVELFGTESFSLRSIESLPYTLLVVELPRGPVAVLAVYRSDRLVGVLQNDSSDAVAWARAKIDDWWGAAESLPLSSASDE